MARNNYGVFKVLNPTPYEVSVGIGLMNKDGIEYIFKPFEEKDVYNSEHVHHMITSNKHANKGLVWLNYDENMKKTYPDYSEFKKIKAKEGLERVIQNKSFILTFEKQAEAAAELGKHLIDKKSMNSAKKEKELNSLIEIFDKLETNSENKKVEVSLPEAPEWMIGKEETKKEVEIKTETKTVKKEMVEGKEYIVAGDKVVRVKGDRYMVNSKFISREDAEEYIESWRNDN